MNTALPTPKPAGSVTALRDRLVRAEQCAVAATLRPLPGEPVVEVVGAWPALTADAVRVGPDWRGPGGARVSPLALALRSVSAGALLLTHVLDQYRDWRQALAEAERVLVPGGQLIVVGLNPWSLCGLREWAAGRGGRARMAPYLHAPGRLRGELQRLGLPVEQVRTVFHRPPVGRAGALTGTSLMDRLGPRLLPRGGGVYLLAARKCRVGMRPLVILPGRRLAVPAGTLGVAVWRDAA